MKISATDPDVGSNAQITYSLHGPGAEEFRLGAHTGEIRTCTQSFPPFHSWGSLHCRRLNAVGFAVAGHETNSHSFPFFPTGELTTSAPLDREQKPTYHLVAKATDGGGRSCQADIMLTVEDTNDNAPRFFPSHCAVAVFDNTTTKTPIAVVSARDLDEGESG